MQTATSPGKALPHSGFESQSSRDCTACLQPVALQANFSSAYIQFKGQGHERLRGLLIVMPTPLGAISATAQSADMLNMTAYSKVMHCLPVALLRQLLCLGGIPGGA